MRNNRKIAGVLSAYPVITRETRKSIRVSVERKYGCTGPEAQALGNAGKGDQAAASGSRAKKENQVLPGE